MNTCSACLFSKENLKENDRKILSRKLINLNQQRIFQRRKDYMYCHMTKNLLWGCYYLNSLFM